jgi:hypothetical protein
MRKSRLTESQIGEILKQGDAGVPARFRPSPTLSLLVRQDERPYNHCSRLAGTCRGVTDTQKIKMASSKAKNRYVS